jgi:lipoprotein-anchoring transpeptidase ErfK/SrfK
MAERMRRLGWIGWGLVALCLIIVAGGAFIGVEYAGAVSLGATSPQPGSLLQATSVDISCELPGFEPGRGNVTLTLDGKQVAAESITLSSGALRAKVSVADGQHDVNVLYNSANIFSRQLSLNWSFSTDTTPADIHITAPSQLDRIVDPKLSINASFSEQVTAELQLDGKPVSIENQGSAAAADLTIKEGQHTFLLRTTDKAGNVSEKTWKSFADFTAPTIDVSTWPTATWKESSKTLSFGIADNFMDTVTVSATLDGAAITPLLKKTSDKGKSFDLSTGELAEGNHTVEIKAQDAAGNASSSQKTFLVNTTEELGAKPMVEGATGADVKLLQQILKSRGFYIGSVTGTLDSATAQALAAYKQAHSLADGPLFAVDMFPMLIGRIVIDKSECKLYLYQDGKLVKTYGVAVGMPQYPTPTGHFKIIVKEKNPTWNPPPSPWAAGKEPVPPGPGNPLGTRWMGTSSPAIGIHGTPQAWSIGSHASHGCIRMRIKEAEDLFDRIYVGTIVDIQP